MAMLAEGRKKQKFSYDPRNLTWSNDDNKFGHKLMEKMGWSKGKGLGVKEDGNVDHVAVKIKNDTKGVGCSKSYVDNWIAHQDDFNALLANLGQDHKSTDDDSNTSKVTSLEQTSKSSKGRLHYQKFTKGKDLSLKSESDLDCVFGKRKSQSGTSTPQIISEPNSDNESSTSTEAVQGIPMVTSTDSVQEYFKKKMAEKLGKMKNASKHVVASPEEDDVSEEFPNDIENDRSISADTDLVNVVTENEPKSKSKKKSKKKKNIIEDSNENTLTEEATVVGETCNVEEKVTKKYKKKKKCVVENEGDLNVDKQTVGDLSNNDCEETVTKKKSKKKRKSSEMNQDMNEATVDNKPDTESDEIKPKKKKNKKRKHEKEVDSEVTVVTKKKKTVRFNLGDDDSEDELDVKDEKDKMKQETCDTSNVDPAGQMDTDNSSVKPDSKLDNSGRKTVPNNKHSKTPMLPELKRHAEAFKGSNINCVSGYVGMPITAYDVKRKLANQRRK